MKKPIVGSYWVHKKTLAGESLLVSHGGLEVSQCR